MPIFGNKGKQKRQEKKANRQAKRASRRALRSCNTGIFPGSSKKSSSSSNDGVSGSCPKGNLKAEKTKVVKAESFSPNKKRLKGRTVGSAKKRERQENKAARKARRANKGHISNYGNPRFL